MLRAPEVERPEAEGEEGTHHQHIRDNYKYMYGVCE